MVKNDDEDARRLFSVMRPGGGIPYDMGGYYLHTLFNLFGSVNRASGFCFTKDQSRPYLNPRHSKFGENFFVDTPNTLVAALEFEGGIAAVFTVSAFSQRNTRTIKLMGTEGEIGGCMEDGEIVLRRFADGTTEHFTVTHDGTKHCGGDGGLMRRFAEAINADERFADARIFEAHRLALEAERVRKRNES